MITKPRPATAQEQIEALIGKANVEFYLSLYANMKRLPQPSNDGVRFISEEMALLKSETEALLGTLKKRGYLSVEGRGRAINAWNLFFRALGDEVQKSEAWTTAAAGHLLHHRPGVKKPFKDEALSVLIYCLYEDVRAAGHVPSPKLISDFLVECNIACDGENLEARDVSDLYHAASEASVTIILYSHYLAKPAVTLFPEKHRNTYQGCLEDTLKALCM